MRWTVAILTLMPGLALAAAPRDVGPPGVRLIISATTERILLPRTQGRIELTVDALSRRITLRPAKSDKPQVLAKQIVTHTGVLCPGIAIRDGAVEMTCRSRRFEAQITPEGKAQYLDINELRGLPWRGGIDAPPLFHYDPWRIGLDQRCPGKTEVAKGECELKEGNVLQAAIHFHAALATPGRQMASVRLGDLALGIGDPITATGWYHRVGPFGVFGRVAGARLCELDGNCLDTTEDVVGAFAQTDSPEPLRTEALMRSARAEAYAGRLRSAIHIIARQARAKGMESFCREGRELLCRRILLEAMREASATSASRPEWVAAEDARHAGKVAPGVAKPLDPAEREYLEELVETYLSLPSWEKGALAIELAQAAAPLAARMGATAFGGSLLAALAPQVPAAQLSDHLLLAAETFLEGDHWARARIVAEYAKSRLADKELRGTRWSKVLRTLSGRAEEDDVSPAVREAIEAEMVATLAELKEARIALRQTKSVLGSVASARETRGAAEAKGKSPQPKAASGEGKR